MFKPHYFIRVLPVDGEEWVAFLKVEGMQRGRIAHDLLRSSSRFRGVEFLSEYFIRRNEGVDAVINNELQVAGSWAPQEQTAVLRAVDARLKSALPNTDATSGEMLRAYEMARQNLEDALQGVLDVVSMDDNEERIRNHAHRILPPKVLKRLMMGVTDPKVVLAAIEPRPRRVADQIALRLQGNDATTRPLLYKITEDEDIATTLLMASMVQLWAHIATPEQKLEAHRLSEQNGVKVLRKRHHRKDKVIYALPPRP